MSRTSSTARSTNFPLILLWAASIAVVVIGYVVMTMSITAQTDLYGAGSQDVQALLNGQAGVTLGTTLVGVGVLGLLIALAVHARNAAAGRARNTENAFDDDIDDEGDDDTQRVAPANAAAAHVATEQPGPVVVEPVPVAPAAVEPTVPPASAPSAPPAATADTDTDTNTDTDTDTHADTNDEPRDDTHGDTSTPPRL